MTALVYHGPRDVSVTDVDDPRIERPTDVLVRVMQTNICGSDLHIYEGRTDMEAGRVLEHCEHCERGLTNCSLTAQPEGGLTGGVLGFAEDPTAPDDLARHGGVALSRSIPLGSPCH